VDHIIDGLEPEPILIMEIGYLSLEKGLQIEVGMSILKFLRNTKKQEDLHIVI